LVSDGSVLVVSTIG